MRLKEFKPLLLSGMLAIPLEPSAWKQIPYGSTPTHTLSSEKGLKIEVEKSASALVYQFEAPKKIKSIEIELTQKGSIDYKEKKMGEKGGDDFPLRLGLVMSGTKKLSWSQKLIAPGWVKELYKLAPKNSGLDRVYYFVIAQEKPRYSKRFHPFSELLEEEVVGVIRDGVFKASLTPPEGEVLGFWLSSDGDDTKSSFTLTINKLVIHD